MKATTANNLVYIMLTVAIAALLWVLAPASQYKPRGVFLSSSQQQYSPSSEAKVFADSPTDYKKIGIINISLYSGANKPNQTDEKSVIYDALHKIAKHGATGLVVDQLYYLPQAKYGKLSAGYHLVGKAIKKRGVQ